MENFRKVIHDGDLILEHKVSPLPIVPFFGEWQPYRNESEEVRLLKQHMDEAFMKYKELQRYFVIAQANVKTDLQLLRMYQVDNSHVEYTVPVEQSILEERDGIKYNFGKSGSSGGNTGRSNGNGNGNPQRKKQKMKTVPFMQALSSFMGSVKVTVPDPAAN